MRNKTPKASQEFSREFSKPSGARNSFLWVIQCFMAKVKSRDKDILKIHEKKTIKVDDVSTLLHVTVIKSKGKMKTQLSMHMVFICPIRK